jgi:hypothetical protein
MVKTLELAISKASTLSEADQEHLGRDLLERIEVLAQLRADLDIGIRQLDAGLGKELDVEALLQRFNAEHARD